MAIIDNIDGPNRRIYLSADTKNSSVHPIDIYKEMRTFRQTDENLRKYDVFLSAFGNVPKGSGKATERYIRENDGTRIVPYDSDGYLTITGTIITDDGNEGINCFDRISLVNQVDINYVPPQVEIIKIIQGSAVTEQDIIDISDAIWNDNLVNRITENSAGFAMFQILSSSENNAKIVDHGDGTKTVTIFTSDTTYQGDPIIYKEYTITLIGNTETKTAI